MTSLTASQTFAPTPMSQTFGKYLLFERIGAGGMAEVFRAVAIGPENFQRTLVIKRILPHLCQDPAFVQMFIDEAKVSGLLAHPNLVQIFEFGKIGDSFFIAMEYVHGRTLTATLKLAQQLGRMIPVAAATEVARQLCTGLEYAHSLRSADGTPLGIVHRDITPSNLMLSFHGAVKILDFGIARVADGLRQTQTQAGALKGKISYMSPEQIQLQEVDHRSDIFSLGVVLHEMLSGRRLFRADSDIRASRMVLELPIQPPSLYNAAVSPALDRIVMRALARDVEARYATASAMALDLEQAMLEERMSPREHIKLLHQLFPGEALAAGDAGVVLPPAVAALAQGADRATPRKNLDAQDVFAALSGAERTPGAGNIHGSGERLPGASGLSTAGGLHRASRRRRLVIGSLALAVAAAAVVFVVVRPRASAPGAGVAAGANAPLATTKGPSSGAAALPAAPATVRCSLDSTPQDAVVVRGDSGAVLGRTPLTITLPASPGALSFRFEKPGYLSAVHRVIPDLDKSIRVDLVPAGSKAPPIAAPAPPEQRPGRAAARPTVPRRKAARAATAPAPPENRPRDASKQFRSATPVNPFDM